MYKYHNKNDDYNYIPKFNQEQPLHALWSYKDHPYKDQVLNFRENKDH